MQDCGTLILFKILIKIYNKFVNKISIFRCELSVLDILNLNINKNRKNWVKGSNKLLFVPKLWWKYAVLKIFLQNMRFYAIIN